MKYMLLMYADESVVQNYTPDEHQAAAKAWYAFGKEAEAAGILLSNNGLSTANQATSVRLRNGKTLITDGPFAETHEQLAGYYLMNCKDIDEAIHWAAKVPLAAYGTIEVRPLNQWSQ